MDLTPEQQAKAKVLFEYEEAKKAIAQCRDDIQLWGKTLIAIGEAILNHPATIVFNGQQSKKRGPAKLRSAGFLFAPALFLQRGRLYQAHQPRTFVF
jgi:hypothetical protein